MLLDTSVALLMEDRGEGGTSLLESAGRMDLGRGAAATMDSDPAMHPWFVQAAQDRHDREAMPLDLVRRLLLDERFQPGQRPASVINAQGASTLDKVNSTCLTRSQRVFKEYCPVPRRTNSVDFWHNAGGKRSKKPLPSHEKPLVWRWYGAIEQPIVDDEGTKRMATYNYHLYKLAEHMDCTGDGPPRIPVIYHIFMSRTLYKLQCPEHSGRKAPNKNVESKAARSTPPTSAPSARHPAVLANLVCANTATGESPAASTRQLNFVPSKPRLAMQAPAAYTKTNFVSFHKTGKILGELSLNQTGSIALNSRGGDVAEWHELEEGHEELLEGDIVAISKRVPTICVVNPTTIVLSAAILLSFLTVEYRALPQWAGVAQRNRRRSGACCRVSQGNG